MIRIAVTGHRGLTGSLSRVVIDAIQTTVRIYADRGIVGVSCLADGADQYFARTVLELGGSLEAVVLDSVEPQPRTVADQAEFDALLPLCTVIRRIPCDRATGETHMRASLAMLEGVDLLVAVWDGRPARKYGGTADVVQHARDAGLPVVVLWPPGVTRPWPLLQQNRGTVHRSATR